MISKLKNLLFQNINTKQTIAKNMFWLIISQIGSRIIRAIIVIYAARVLGTEGYGIFSYAIGLATFFTIFADLGITPILTREVSKHPDDLQYFAVSFWIKIFLLFITTLLIIFFAPHFSNIKAAIVLMPFVALIVVFDNIREFATAYFRGRNKMEIEALAVLATNIAITIFGFITLFYIKTPFALIISYTVSTGIGALLAMWLLRHELSFLVKAFNKNIIVPLLQMTWPITIFTFFGALITNIDILMLGWFKNAADVGLYSASQKVIQVLYTFPSIIGSSTFPNFAKFVEQKLDEKTRYLMENVITMVFMFSVPLAVGGIVLAPSIIHFLYSDAYFQSATVFRILLFSVPFVFSGLLFSNYILAYDKQKKLIFSGVISGIVNIIFAVILIPLYGINGAALATAISLIIFNSLIWRLSKQLNNFSTLPHLPKIFIAALIMGEVGFGFDYLKIPVLVTIFLSALFYGLLLYFLKEHLIIEMVATILRFIGYKRSVT